jgi:hypothetical protein
MQQLHHNSATMKQFCATLYGPDEGDQAKTGSSVGKSLRSFGLVGLLQTANPYPQRYLSCCLTCCCRVAAGRLPAAAAALPCGHPTLLPPGLQLLQQQGV